ncbi:MULTISPECIES: HNH/ENDO VII family nuclease [unclassified Exiguobacterium]|uniref:HNH/ENDO VII family nuclease n=1 Tax=unclassified Exiguobacterium TaxID=2644629 RepID=UPI001BE61808|nr:MULTISPECIES: HNH/ENDO VII family nuclease [unclassified Exiguobacterium]
MIETFKLIEPVMEKMVSLDDKLKKIDLLDQPLEVTDVRDGEKTYRSLDESLENASEAERKIYDEANLETNEVNGRECLTRTDIDPDETDGRGRTNLEKMIEGKAPVVSGEPIELHHIGQKNDGPLAELTKYGEHRSNSAILHEKRTDSEIDRNEFGKERAAHWKARAELIIAEREGTI